MNVIIEFIKLSFNFCCLRKLRKFYKFFAIISNECAKNIISNKKAKILKIIFI